MASENEIEYRIEGDSLEECKRQLYDKYGKDYIIKDKKTEFKRAGFLKKQKAVVVVTYAVNHQKSYDINKNESGYYRADRQYNMCII